MKTISIIKYIGFGTELRFLQDAAEGNMVHGDGRIFNNITSFLNQLETYSLPITYRASQRLIEFKETISSKDRDYRLNSNEASELSEIMTEIRKTLTAEAQGNVAYIVTDKRIDVNKLLNNQPSLLAPGIFDDLPDYAKYDFKEACICIAFIRSTAAAFHLLRGTEAVLRELYKYYVIRDRKKILLWGPMTEHMRERRKKPPSEILDDLDSIRRTYRNPTQHPDKIYDIQEVQDLFGLCVKVINQMVPLLK